MLDSSVLAPYVRSECPQKLEMFYHLLNDNVHIMVTSMQDFGEDCSSESDDDHAESAEDCASESETEDENEASNEEEWNSSAEARSDCSENEVDVQATAEAALKKLVPFNLDDFAKVMSVDKHDHEKHA